MAFSDFIKKVKILLQGDSKNEDEGYSGYRDGSGYDEGGTTEEFYPG